MPPVARIVGVIVVWAVCPAWLAAQGPRSATAVPAPSRSASDTSWDSPLPGGAAPAGPFAAGGVQTASYETPASPAAPAKAASTTPLPTPGNAERQTELPPRKLSAGGTPRAPAVGVPELLTTASSLAVVLGLFFLFAWIVRRAGPKGSTVLPGEVLEVLGRAPLALRQQVYLIRCGRKLILVHACPDNVETLTEITEPDEVDRLLGLCRQTQSTSATAAFRQVFQQFAGEPAASGFLGDSEYDEVRLANAGIARRAYGRREEDDV